jgi:hypothetical protein
MYGFEAFAPSKSAREKRSISNDQIFQTTADRESNGIYEAAVLDEVLFDAPTTP